MDQEINSYIGLHRYIGRSSDILVLEDFELPKPISYIANYGCAKPVGVLPAAFGSPKWQDRSFHFISLVKCLLHPADFAQSKHCKVKDVRKTQKTPCAKLRKRETALVLRLRLFCASLKTDQMDRVPMC